MTPKDKAIDLLHEFYFSLPNNGSLTGINNINVRWDEGKMCALIAVGEMIRIARWGGDIDNEIEDDSKEFYIKVKQELEKL